MFTKLFTKLKVYLIMFAAFAAFAGVAYWYYQDTQKALRTYAENQSKLETSLQIQQETTQSLQADLKLMTTTIETLNEEFAQSRLNVKNLEELFTTSSDGTSRDFGKLTIESPEYVEGRIQQGNDEVFRCIELLSGQEAQQGEEDNAEYIDCISSTSNTN